MWRVRWIGQLAMSRRVNCEHGADKVTGKSLCCALIVVAVLSGCVATPPIAPSAIQSPEQWFDEPRHWEAVGRVALSDGERGGQLTIEWRHRDGQYTVYLRNRLGTHWWRLAYDEAGAQLVSYDDLRLQGQQADVIASEAVGWPIPVEAMSFWLRGLTSPDDDVIERDPDGQLLALRHGSWRVQFVAYRPVVLPGGDRLMLPSRLEIASPPNRVRVALNGWDWPKSVSKP